MVVSPFPQFVGQVAYFNLTQGHFSVSEVGRDKVPERVLKDGGETPIFQSDI